MVLVSPTRSLADRFVPDGDATSQVSLSVARTTGAPEVETIALVDCGPLAPHLEIEVDEAVGEIRLVHGTLCGSDTVYFDTTWALGIELPIVRMGTVTPGGKIAVGSLAGADIALSVPVAASANVGSTTFDAPRRNAADAIDLTGRLELTPERRHRIVDLAGKHTFAFQVGASLYTVEATVLLNLIGTDEVLDAIFASGFESGDLSAWGAVTP